jgi:hypothetical protein
MNELLAHLVGDYFLQSHWLANEKTKRWFPAIVHGLLYTVPFLLLTTDPVKLLIISVTHMVIDRYRLANWVARIKNWTFTPNGYPEETPAWLTVWLMIITDNTMHLLINHFVLKQF